jgi:hypothetical protein
MNEAKGKMPKGNESIYLMVLKLIRSKEEKSK